MTSTQSPTPFQTEGVARLVTPCFAPPFSSIEPASRPQNGTVICNAVAHGEEATLYVEFPFGTSPVFDEARAFSLTIEVTPGDNNCRTVESLVETLSGLFVWTDPAPYPTHLARIAINHARRFAAWVTTVALTGDGLNVDLDFGSLVKRLKYRTHERRGYRCFQTVTIVGDCLDMTVH